MSMLSVIKLNISNRLKNRTFRRRFFKQQAQDDVAQQIRALRVKREMRQIDLAKTARMKQSAVSRVEQSNYSRWTFTTLLRIADALDARVRVIFDPFEDVIVEYEQHEKRIAEMASNFETREKVAEMFSAAIPNTQLGSAQNKRPVLTLPHPLPVTVIGAGQTDIEPFSRSVIERQRPDADRANLLS